MNGINKEWPESGGALQLETEFPAAFQQRDCFITSLISKGPRLEPASASVLLARGEPRKRGWDLVLLGPGRTGGEPGPMADIARWSLSTWSAKLGWVSRESTVYTSFVAQTCPGRGGSRGKGPQIGAGAEAPLVWERVGQNQGSHEKGWY